MTTQQITIAVLVTLALIFGWLVSKSAKNREKIYGGAPAEFFHFLAAAAFAIIAPSVLTSIFVLRLHFVELLIVAVSLFVTALIACVLFAVFEKPALAKALESQQDRGWTEQDARTSGL